MREYYLFLMKEDFTTDYIGKEYKIFSLLQSSFHNDIVKKQREFITYSIPKEVNKIIQQALCKDVLYNFSEDKHQLIVKNEQATLQIVGSFATLHSTGESYLEARFFEVLRQWKKGFFAFEKTKGSYGWLTAVKMSNFS